MTTALIVVGIIALYLLIELWPNNLDRRIRAWQKRERKANRG